MASGVLCADFRRFRWIRDTSFRDSCVTIHLFACYSRIHVEACRARTRQWRGQRDVSSLSNQFARSVRCLPKWSSGESTAGFWLSDQALDRTLKGSALIKYNSTEAAVSSVNPDEQRMNRYGRGTREPAMKRVTDRSWTWSRVQAMREFPRSIDYHACRFCYIGQPFGSAPTWWIDC